MNFHQNTEGFLKTHPHFGEWRLRLGEQLFRPSCILKKQAENPAIGFLATTEDCVHKPNDEQLVEHIQAGDMTAFGILYERHKSVVFAYCLRLLGDEQSAQDAAQETFLKIRSGSRSLQHRSAFRSWMYKIAHNEVMQSLRRSRRNGQALSDDDVWDHNTPLETYQQLEQRELVHKYLTQLKAEYKEVLVLREFDQLSYVEIADITGATKSSVKSRIFKARKALLKKLTPYFGKE